MKVACCVLTGGKLERAYLSGFGRGIYYGSYQSPRTITWVVGTVILVAMMATGFLGYVSVAVYGIAIKLQYYLKSYFISNSFKNKNLIQSSSLLLPFVNDNKLLDNFIFDTNLLILCGIFVILGFIILFNRRWSFNQYILATLGFSLRFALRTLKIQHKE